MSSLSKYVSTDTVPLSILSEIVDEWCRKYEAVRNLLDSQSMQDYREKRKFRFFSAQQWIANEAGLDVSYVGKIRKGQIMGKNGNPQTMVSFKNADKIVTAIDAHHEWHTGRLAPYYLRNVENWTKYREVYRRARRANATPEQAKQAADDYFDYLYGARAA